MFWDFVAQNWLGILIVLAAVVYILFLSVTKQWTKVREFAYQLMLLAEKNFQDGEGELKFNFVVTMVYRYIPVWLKIFVKEEDIKKLIEKWYQLAKDYLDDGEINNSILQIKSTAKK